MLAHFFYGINHCSRIKHRIIRTRFPLEFNSKHVSLKWLPSLFGKLPTIGSTVIVEIFETTNIKSMWQV
jgi:hypothetical protein